MVQVWQVSFKTEKNVYVTAALFILYTPSSPSISFTETDPPASPSLSLPHPPPLLSLCSLSSPLPLLASPSPRLSLPCSPRLSLACTPTFHLILLLEVFVKPGLGVIAALRCEVQDMVVLSYKWLYNRGCM